MELRDLGRNPISENQPAGEDIRSDVLFDGLSTEIAKLSSPSSISGIDWQKVLTQSRDILDRHSKDLLVCSYLCVALLRMQGLKGLAVGIHIYHDLLTTYWETLFPAKSRMKGRRNAIEWWLDAVRAGLGALSKEQWPKEDVDRLVEDLDGMRTFLQENLDDPPGLDSLTLEVLSLLSEEEKPMEEEAPPEARPPKQEAPPPAKTRAAEPKPIEREGAGDDPEAILDGGLDLLRRAAGSLMDRNPRDALFFRVNRVVAWTSVTGLPPSDAQGRTFLPPPEQEVIQSLNGMLQVGNWEDLLQAAESHVPRFLFWLDLDWYAVQSLESMNERPAAGEVAGLTALYARRLAGIEGLSFSDGTPFVSADTREWLEGLESRGERRKGPAGPSGESDLEKRMAEEIAEAQGLIKSGQVEKMLGAVKGALDCATSGRERFIRTMWLCRLLAEARQKRLVFPFCRELLLQLETFKVHQWEPALAVDGLTTILSVIRGQSGEETEVFSESVLEKLSLIDPARALGFTTSSPKSKT